MVDDNNNNSGGVGGRDIYERAKPMLVSLSDSYPEEGILICDSRPSSCPAYISNYFS